MAQEIRLGDLVGFIGDVDDSGAWGQRHMLYGNVTRVWKRRHSAIPQTLTIVTGDDKTYVRYADCCTLVMDVSAGACAPTDDVDAPLPVEPVEQWTDWKTCGQMRDVSAGVYVGPSAIVRPF